MTKPEPQLVLLDFFENLGDCKDKSAFTHGMHPYPAKFIPHIPRALIEAYTAPGDVVFDPMCGSGTTLVEANLLGRPAIGCDLNPVAALAASAKSRSLSDAQLRNLLEVLETVESDISNASNLRGDPPHFTNRDKWFEPVALAELSHLRSIICDVTDAAVKNALLATFSAIVVPVSNQESETRWCAKPRPLEAGDVLRRFARKLRVTHMQLRSFSEVALETSTIFRCDSRNLPLLSETVSLMVTSPPYANSHDYYLYNKLRMFWLGEDVKTVQDSEIGSRNRHSDRKAEISHYLNAMELVLGETKRVLRPGGRAAIVVADAVIRKEFFDMGTYITEVGEKLGFVSDAQFTFDHRSYNTTFQRGFGTTRQKQTHVLVFLKD